MNNTLKLIIRNTIIGALYIALTLVFSAVSYGEVQFRISEVLIIFVLFNKDYIIGLTLGCLISNIFSPMALYDVFFGTTATLLSLVVMTKLKNPFIALVAPVVINALIVALELKIAFGAPYFESLLYVGAGEALVLYLLAIPLYYAIRDNSKVLEVIDAKIEIFDRPAPYFKLDAFFLTSLTTLIMLLMPTNGNNLLVKENFNLIVITIPIIYLCSTSLCFIKLKKPIFLTSYILLELGKLITYSLLPLWIKSLEYNVTYILLIVFFSAIILLSTTPIYLKENKKEKY